MGIKIRFKLFFISVAILMSLFLIMGISPLNWGIYITAQHKEFSTLMLALTSSSAVTCKPLVIESWQTTIMSILEGMSCRNMSAGFKISVLSLYYLLTGQQHTMVTLVLV
jgi:hypothetical protein